jgi:hypothetical protein
MRDLERLEPRLEFAADGIACQVFTIDYPWGGSLQPLKTTKAPY